MSKPKVFPPEIYVWACDYDDGKPVLTLDPNLDDVEEGEVAVYKLTTIGKKITTNTFKANK